MDEGGSQGLFSKESLEDLENAILWEMAMLKLGLIQGEEAREKSITIIIIMRLEVDVRKGTK